MASVSCVYSTHLEAKFLVSGLQNYACDYDKFVWRVFQSGVEIETYTQDRNSELGKYYNFYFVFTNPDYLGNNPFSPGCTYTLYLDCYWGGVCYTLPAVQFTTKSIAAPTVSNIQPQFYPYVKDQGSAGNCVAQSLATAMEIFQYLNTKIAEHYSVAYIYGSDGSSGSGMDCEEGVKNCKASGSPRWEMVSTAYPDNTAKSAAVSLYNNADTYTTKNASNQKFTDYKNVDFYDTDTVAGYISKYGYFMLNFRIPQNFYDVGSDGLVPQPDEYSGENHSIALIGLTAKGGKKHWIAHNSWGTSWGDGGLCYIPYDWGCGVLSPFVKNTDAVASWTCESYAVWNTGTFRTNSYTPTITDITQTDNQKSINVTWNGNSSNDVYLVFARQSGDTNWWKKAAVSTTKAVIPVDMYGDYEVMIVGLSSTYRVCSAQSNIGYVTIKKENPRPSDFSWIYAKTSGGYFNLTANEWVAFCDSVITFLSYTGLLNGQIGSNDLGISKNTTYYDLVVMSKESAIQDGDFTADAFNYVRYVVGSINKVGTGIATQYRGDIIYAYLLNTVVDKLNLIE
jgi:hypothetical protein